MRNRLGGPAPAFQNGTVPAEQQTSAPGQFICQPRASRGGMTEKAVASASASVAEGASALALIVPMGLEPVEALMQMMVPLLGVIINFVAA